MKLNILLSIILITNLFSVTFQTDTKTLYLSINVEEKQFQNNGLVEYLKKIKDEIDNNNVLAIALQESTKVSLEKTVVDEIRALVGDTKFCEVTRKHGLLKDGLDMVVCIDDKHQREEKVKLKLNVWAWSTSAARSKGAIGLCYQKDKDSCQCFLDIHAETNPDESITHVQYALEKAIEHKDCTNPQLYIVGDWNIRPYYGAQNKKITSADDKDIEKLKHNNEESFKLVEAGDIEATKHIVDKFNSVTSKVEAQKDFKLFFPGNAELLKGQFTYKYNVGAEGIDITSKSGLKVGNKKKESGSKWCFPIGWLDKLGCVSKTNDCNIKADSVKFAQVPELRIGDHMPQKISFTISGPSGARRQRFNRILKKAHANKKYKLKNY